MESVLSHVGAGFCHGIAPLKGLGEMKMGVIGTHFNPCSIGIGGRRPRRVVLVKAEVEAVSINPDIRKSEEKVVDSAVVTELSKPLTPYCR
ncbi:CDGSH iron sulfur domain-containing protein 2-A [Sesbania bispinosa]|nr:CDGSH iron sulfur domain-containing protein 2-A [Sesbania bispinosa]